MKHKYFFLNLSIIFFFTVFLGTGFTASAQNPESSSESKDSEKQNISKVMIIGDSMTGWMAERLNEYGRENGFEVATVVWDGSTISKWGNSSSLKSIITKENPDAIIVSLGMNEMFERNPKLRLSQSLDKIKETFGDIPYVWIGPPSWPGHAEAREFNTWMTETIGSERYFNSSELKLPRQSDSNPHPSRKGIEIWVDEIADWLPLNGAFKINISKKPESGKISRPKSFIYKRMKEKL